MWSLNSTEAANEAPTSLLAPEDLQWSTAQAETSPQQCGTFAPHCPEDKVNRDHKIRILTSHLRPQERADEIMKLLQDPERIALRFASFMAIVRKHARRVSS